MNVIVPTVVSRHRYVIDLIVQEQCISRSNTCHLQSSHHIVITSPNCKAQSVQTDGRTDRQRDMQTVKQADGLTNGQTDGQIINMPSYSICTFK